MAASPAPPVFVYGRREMAGLCARDPLLGAVIERFGWIERAMGPEPFTALARSLVAQQISNAAAATVWRRLSARVGEWTPAPLAQLPLAELQACGLPMRKAAWLRGLGERVASGALDLAALATRPDAEVVDTLTTLPGVGVWTAEMWLIFALGRPDVVSWGDGALRRGMARLYGLERLERTQFLAYRERYRPYGTVASFYLWALAGEASAR